MPTHTHTHTDAHTHTHTTARLFITWMTKWKHKVTVLQETLERGRKDTKV